MLDRARKLIGEEISALQWVELDQEARPGRDRTCTSGGRPQPQNRRDQEVVGGAGRGDARDALVQRVIDRLMGVIARNAATRRPEADGFAPSWRNSASCTSPAPAIRGARNMVSVRWCMAREGILGPRALGEKRGEGRVKKGMLGVVTTNGGPLLGRVPPFSRICASDSTAMLRCGGWTTSSSATPTPARKRALVFGAERAGWNAVSTIARIGRGVRRFDACPRNYLAAAEKERGARRISYWKGRTFNDSFAAQSTTSSSTCLAAPRRYLFRMAHLCAARWSPTGSSFTGSTSPEQEPVFQAASGARREIRDLFPAPLPYTAPALTFGLSTFSRQATRPRPSIPPTVVRALEVPFRAGRVQGPLAAGGRLPLL